MNDIIVSPVIRAITVKPTVKRVILRPVGIQGPPGPTTTLDTVISDSDLRADRAYSNIKTEERLGEEVGDEDLNFSILFRNQLSQGG